MSEIFTFVVQFRSQRKFLMKSWVIEVELPARLRFVCRSLHFQPIAVYSSNAWSADFQMS